MTMGSVLTAREIADVIAGMDDIIISAHTGADGDAIGSVAALLRALRGAGKNVRAVIEALPIKYAEIPGALDIGFQIDDGFSYKAFIALDCGDKARLGRFEKYFDSAEITVNIDHHKSNDFFGTYNCVEENASATSEVIYKIFEESKMFSLDSTIASALYAGLLYDTGGFRHASTTAYTYMAASELIAHGADFNRIYKRLFHTARFAELKILSTAFKNMKSELGGRLVWTSVTSGEMAEVSARASDLDNVVDYLMSVEGAQIAAFIYQKDINEFKISLRSEPEFDVSGIAYSFGGGGHKNAAGATFFGTLSECAAKTVAEIGNVFKRGF